MKKRRFFTFRGFSSASSTSGPFSKSLRHPPRLRGTGASISASDASRPMSGDPLAVFQMLSMPVYVNYFTKSVKRFAS